MWGEIEIDVKIDRGRERVSQREHENESDSKREGETINRLSSFFRSPQLLRMGQEEARRLELSLVSLMGGRSQYLPRCTLAIS